MNHDESRLNGVATPDGHIDNQGTGSGPHDEQAGGNKTDFQPKATTGQSFGARLRMARTHRGLDLQACGAALHLPSRLLRKLEADDYEGIDYTVYLRSYLDKYASYLGIDDDTIRVQLDSLHMRQPDLVITQTHPWWQRTFQRYSSAVTYLVLTAVIVVPLIWLGLNGVLKRDITKLTPLDAAPVGAHSAALVGTGLSPGSGAHKPSAAKPSAGGVSRSEKPLMASMTPFTAMEGSGPEAPAPEIKSAPQEPATHHLTLDLQDRSWVEIVNDAGTRLEYALLPAGTHKSYSSDRPLDVRIGNADAARVEVDGKPLNLDPFQHANVAHFSLSGTGTVQPANG